MTDPAPAAIERHEFQLRQPPSGGFVTIAASGMEVGTHGVSFYDEKDGQRDVHTFASHPVLVERGVALP